MRQVDQRLLLQDYRKARSRANRYLRDSNPPLSKKGLAKLLNLNACAFNQFVNGTIILNAGGEKVSSAEWDNCEELYFATNWTDRRLARYIERVETECWTLGISHGINQNIAVEAHNEVELLRLDKYWQFLTEIQSAADLHVASSLMLWNVCAQEATDAREHLRATMSVNALRVLADLVDRKQDGNLCSLRLAETDQRDRLELTLDAVSVLVEGVLSLSEDASDLEHNTKAYECYHKALGYGGYDKFYLGVALDSTEAMASGMNLMHESVTTDHSPNDGHIANTAAATELALEIAHSQSEEWAVQFGELVHKRIRENPEDHAAQRLSDMCIPKTKLVWNSLKSTTMKAMSRKIVTPLAFLLCLFSIMSHSFAQRTDFDAAVDQIIGKGGTGTLREINPIAAEGSRTRPAEYDPILEPPLDPATLIVCSEAEVKGSVCTSATGLALPGDSNLDGVFDTADFTLSMKSGGFEDLVQGNSDWNGGDWNQDGEFDSSDIRIAFELNWFSEMPSTSTTAAVPEPSSIALLLIGLLALLPRRR